MTNKSPITQSTIIFIALTIAGISVAVSAQLVPDGFTQTIMISIGSAIFGAGLTFFLVRIFALTEN